MDVLLEPVGELVLGDVLHELAKYDGSSKSCLGELRRVRKVREVIRVDWVVQYERFIAKPPAVTDPLVLLDDEGRNSEHGEASCHHQAVLSTAEDDDGGVLLELEGLLASVKPVLARALRYAVKCAEGSASSQPLICRRRRPRDGA